MFGKRHILHVVTSTLVAICYLVFAGASVVHEVSHIGSGYSAPMADRSTGTTLAPIQKGNTGSDELASLPCFLCLTGYSYSILPSYSFAHAVAVTETEQTIAAVPMLYSREHSLPSLRAPPSAC